MKGVKRGEYGGPIATHARWVFSRSLITSFPEIARGRRPLLKSVVFCVCLAGLVYQTSVFLSLYFSYPTVVVVETTSPSKVEQPAVTVCNKNKRRRSVVCEITECACKDMLQQMMCFYHPRLCPSDVKEFYLKVSYTDTVDRSPCSEVDTIWREAESQSHPNNTISSCTKSSARMKETVCQTPYVRSPARETNHPFGANICNIIESQIGHPDAETTFHDNTFHMKLRLRLYPDDYLKTDEIPSALVLVHDRRALVNPYDGGTTLQGGKRYNAFVSMTEKVFLPPPYATNCVDYEAEWRKNNGTGPLDQKACIEYCKMMSLKQKGDCMDRLIVYPHQERLCPMDSIRLTEAIVKNCTKFCGNPCVEKSYKVRYEEMSAFLLKNEDGKVITCGHPVHVNLPCEGSSTLLEIYFNQFTLTKVSHLPKFDSIALFSYLGGFLGIWAGLSLVSIFDLLESLADLLHFACRGWKKKKKRRSAVEAI